MNKPTVRCVARCYDDAMSLPGEGVPDGRDPFEELRGWQSEYAERVIGVLRGGLGITPKSSEYRAVARGITEALFLRHEANPLMHILSPSAELAVIWGIDQMVRTNLDSGDGLPT